MRVDLRELETRAYSHLISCGHNHIATRAAADCAWLQAVGYTGLKLLQEATSDSVQDVTLEKDLMGLDLRGVSCVFLADQIASLYAQHGRIFLRNVRHGLYLVPMSVRGNFGIGCPVDPAFAFGGERTKNPYVDKIEIAQRDGVDVDDDLWQAFRV